MARARLIALVAAGLAAVAWMAMAAGSRSPAPPVGPSMPPGVPAVNLAVLVVFDQMRGDYVDKWRPLFRSDGFQRVQSEGAWFTHCLYPYATTTTGAGHASMLSGTCPDKHGIINNSWYDPRAADGTGDDAEVNCAESTRYEFVPAPKGGGRGLRVGNPDRMLSETVGDVLKRVTKGKGKVFGLSLKDRAAVLPTGKRPDGAYWFEGQFVTSTYYTARLPPWVRDFNASGAADRYKGRLWDRFRPDIDYVAYSGPDDVRGEGSGYNKGRVFPYPMGGANGAGYYGAMENSPYGNDLVLAFAKACVRAEKLGRRGVPDLLTVSFSSNDKIGHTWGPDSQEVFDVTLRSDALVADFLHFLDREVGPGNYALAITADHGVGPLPEVNATNGGPGKRVDAVPLIKGGVDRLTSVFGKPKAGGPGWLDAVSYPWFYINKRAAETIGKSPAQVARVLADQLASHPEVERVFTREQLLAPPPPDDEFLELVRRSFHPTRSGDVYVLLKQFNQLSNPLNGKGTSHGTPYYYDRHVPLMVYGPGLTGGPRDEPVTPQAAAAILSGFLGQPPPRDADFPVPTTLWNP